MACAECDKNKDENIRGYLKFTGGPHRPFAEQGPFNSRETGKIYRVVLRLADLPFWELTDEEPEVQEVQEVQETPDEEESVEILVDQEDDDPIPLESSGGLTRALGGKPPSDADFFEGVDDETLKRVIESNGGKVDGRWGRDKLIEEAQKTQ